MRYREHRHSTRYYHVLNYEIAALFRQHSATILSWLQKNGFAKSVDFERLKRPRKITCHQWEAMRLGPYSHPTDLIIIIGNLLSRNYRYSYWVNLQYLQRRWAFLNFRLCPPLNRWGMKKAIKGNRFLPCVKSKNDIFLKIPAKMAINKL